MNAEELALAAKKLPTRVADTKVQVSKEDFEALIPYAKEMGIIGDRSAILALGERANGIAQGLRSKNGCIFERAVAEFLTELVGDVADVKPRWNIVGRKRQPIDIAVFTDGCDYFFSLKFSARERAENTWRKEHEDLSNHATRTTKKPFQLIGLTMDRDPKRVRDQLAKLPYLRVISTWDQDVIADLIWEIRESA